MGKAASVVRIVTAGAAGGRSGFRGAALCAHAAANAPLPSLQQLGVWGPAAAGQVGRHMM
jgi:hypothetical protein